MAIDPFSLAATGISAIFGGIAGNSQARAQNKAVEAQYGYDKQSWKYGKQRINADYRQNMKIFGANVRNEETLAQFKDATNLDDWKYSLAIKDFEYQSQMRQYRKSDQLFNQQMTFNSMAAEVAREAEYRKLQEATNEIAFQNQDMIIKAMESQGISAVKGQQGRSAAKTEQMNLAALGRNQAILAESLLSAKADTQTSLRKIASDKYGADIAAQAERMLEPWRGLTPPQPIRTPRAEMVAPRKPEKFDYGPKPIKGAKASSAAALLGAGADLVKGIAAAIPSGSSGSKSNLANNDFSFNFVK